MHDDAGREEERVHSFVTSGRDLRKRCDIPGEGGREETTQHMELAGTKKNRKALLPSSATSNARAADYVSQPAIAKLGNSASRPH